MPVGNGDIAAGVYAIENGDLFLLLAKNDAFSYCGDLYKTGRVRVSLNPNPFAKGKPFRQTLDLPTASILLEADGVKLRIWADANRPLYHVEIDSPHELSLAAEPEFWNRYTQWKGPDKTLDVRLERSHKLLWYFHVGNRSFCPDEMRMTYQLEQSEKILPDPYRYFFRFAMAAQSRGRIQAKFNGGTFTQQIRTTKAPQYPAGEVLQADDYVRYTGDTKFRDEVVVPFCS
jgi:hypothetical protein